MHFFNEDVSRCFSEQSKIFSKELSIPLNAGREVWARIHGCDNAHEANQKIKQKDPEFCESVIASLRTLGRFPGAPFTKQFPAFFKRGGASIAHDGIKGLDLDDVQRSALKAKGIPRRWSKGLVEEVLFRGSPDAGFIDEMTHRGGVYLAIEGKKIDQLSELFQKTSAYRRQRRVKGVFLGFQEWINNEDFIHSISAKKLFDVWTLRELEDLFSRQVRKSKAGSDVGMWEDRAWVAAKAILGLISIGHPAITMNELSSYFNLDKVLELRSKVVESGLESSPKNARVVTKLSDFLWSLPGFTEEDCALSNLNPECYKQFGYLSMQFSPFLDSLTEENTISTSNLFPDMTMPFEKKNVQFYLNRAQTILKDLPDYSFVFIDIRRLGGDDKVNKEVVEKMIEICREHRIYAIWCGSASIEEQDVMQNYYEDLFEVTDDLNLRPFF